MMNFETYLIDAVKDELDEYLETVYEYDEDQLTALYFDEDGKPLEHKDFMVNFKDKIMSDEIVNAVYGFVAITNPLEEEYMPRLVAYLAAHYYIDNYNVKKNQTVLKFLVESDIKGVVDLFYKSEQFGEALISSFFKSFIEEKRFAETKKQIKKDNREKELTSLYEIAYPPRMFTLNQKLREIVCDLYNYYISLGSSDVEALELTWRFFFEDLDPLHELDELGLEEEEEKFAYKRYTLGLIIGDIYEDVANKPFINSDDPELVIAQSLPIFFVNMGIIGLPGDANVRNKMLKYFILLQDDPKKIKSNRQKTYQEDRIIELKKVNPAYILDELTL